MCFVLTHILFTNIVGSATILGIFKESFSKGGMLYLGTKKDCVYRMFTTWGVKVEKAHGIGYSIHPNTTKMYHDLQEVFKSYIAEFICRCNNCQEVEAEHQKMCGLTQVRIITTWKGEDINMEFVVGLSQTRRKNDSIYVIVERLMKYYNLLVLNLLIWWKSMQVFTLTRLCSCMVSFRPSFHMEVPNSLLIFGGVFKRVRHSIKPRTAFHPQTDGQGENNIQTLKYILWDWLSFYNNSYHLSIYVAPFEVLYGSNFRSSVWWFEVGSVHSVVPKWCMRP